MKILSTIILAASATLANAETLHGIPTVLDGDTIIVEDQRVRLFGIDAFEKDQMCGDDGNVPCGQYSTMILKDLIDYFPVTCDVKSSDRYGRKIAVCFSGNLDLNASMVKSGAALAYRYYSKDYVGYEDYAKMNDIGVWGMGKFENPYEYRKKK